MKGIPGYVYLVEGRSDAGTWQKVGVAADRRRLVQHKGWRPLKATVQVPGYRLADPRTDVEAPVLVSVYPPGEKTPSEADPQCPDCGADMPELPAHGHTEAWHVECRGSREELFDDRLEQARRTNPYPDWSRPRFVDGELDAHSMASRNGRLVHVAEYPHLPNRTPGSGRAEHTAHVATSFYVRHVAADVVLRELASAAMFETSLGQVVRDRFGDDARIRDGKPMRKVSGSGGIRTVIEAQVRLDEMARDAAVSVAFINDRTSGILHAFAAPEHRQEFEDTSASAPD